MLKCSIELRGTVEFGNNYHCEGIKANGQTGGSKTGGRMAWGKYGEELS